MAEQNPTIAVNLDEAARLLDVSKVTLWHWANAGKLKVVKVSPRIVRVRLDEINRLLGGQP